MTYQKPTNGTFTKTDNPQFPLKGQIVLRTLQAQNVALQVIPDRTSSDAPTHDLVEWVNGRLVPLGAAWSKTDKNGREFFSVTMNCEELPRTVYFQLFEQKNNVGHFDVTLSRPRGKKDTADVSDD